MSKYYQKLCAAIANNDPEKYNEIGKQLDNDLFSNEVYELCIDYQKNQSHFLMLLRASSLQTETQQAIVQWLNLAIYYHKIKSYFASNYLNGLKSIIDSKKTLKEKNDQLLELNKKLNSETLIYLAMTESFELINGQGPKVKYFFYLNLVRLAYNVQFVTANEPNTLSLFKSLFLLRRDGFTADEIAKILILQPASSLNYVHEFYENMNEIITREQVFKLSLGMQRTDWNIVVEPWSTSQKLLIVNELTKNLILNSREETYELYTLDKNQILLNSEPQNTSLPIATEARPAAIADNPFAAPSPSANPFSEQNSHRRFSISGLLSEGQVSPLPSNFCRFFGPYPAPTDQEQFSYPNYNDN